MIRSATVGDAHGIAEVNVRSWEAYRGLLPDGLIDAQTVETRLEYWSKAMPFEPPYTTWVAELDGAVVGFAHVGPNRDDDVDGEQFNELWGMYVDPPMFGEGFGRALMAAVEGHLRDTGMAGATLWVLRTNRRARRFYEMAGWLPDGGEKVETTGSGYDIDEVRYRRNLGDDQPG